MRPGIQRQLWSEPCCQACCGERAGGRIALRAVLNETDATKLDMSVIKLSKGLSQKVQALGAIALADCRLARSIHAALFIALSLSLAGCSSPRQSATARTSPPPQTDIKGAQELAATPSPSDAPSKPSSPGPPQARSVGETTPLPRPAPTIATKGAEKLVSPSQSLTVRARERTTPRPEPATTKAAVAEDRGTVSDAPVQALVFKGPPPQAPRHRAGGGKRLAWFALGLGFVVSAVVAARLCQARRVKPVDRVAACKDDLRMPKELLFKEPLTPEKDSR